MKKRIFTIGVMVLVLVLALFAFTACNNNKTEVGVNLIKNGDFETWIEDDADSKKGSFEGWSWSDDWKDSKYERVTPDDGEFGGALGKNYLRIRNDKANYVYLFQSVEVDRKKTYKVSVTMKVPANMTGSKDFRGANVTFLENTEFFFAGYTKQQDWITKTYYVKPMNTDYLTICLALGSEDADVKGEVFFDNISMERVDSVPEGEEVFNFRKATTVRYSSNASGIMFVVFLTLFSAAVLIAAYVLIRRHYASPNAFINFDGGANAPSGKKGSSGAAAAGVWYRSPWFIAAVLMLGTFIVRLIFLLSMYGMGSEMTSLVGFARSLSLRDGVRHAYATYPQLAATSPGVLYILAIVGAMGRGLDNESVSILLRMVNVLADMAVVAMIYFYGRKYVGDRMSSIFAGLYALLPIVFVMSGLTASFASLTVALTLAAIILLVEKKYIPMFVVTVLAVILDIRAMALAPLMTAYLGYMFWRDDDNKKKITKNRVLLPVGLVMSFVLAYILTIPVGIDQIQNGQPFFNFTAIANTYMQYSHFTENALNLYSMVGMNMRLTSTTVNVLNLIFLLVFEIFVVSLYIKNRNKQEVLLLASFTFAVIAVLTLKVDYTYLFIALALGFIYTMISGDKRMYGILSVYSVIGFIGVGQLINNSGFAAVKPTGPIVNFEGLAPELIVFSVIAVITTLYYAYVTYTITNNEKIVDIAPMSEKFPVAFKNAMVRGANRVKAFFSKEK